MIGRAPATIERVEGELGWEITQVYGLTETAPIISICEPLPEHEALSAGERAAIKARQGSSSSLRASSPLSMSR